MLDLSFVVVDQFNSVALWMTIKFEPRFERDNVNFLSKGIRTRSESSVICDTS